MSFVKLTGRTFVTGRTKVLPVLFPYYQPQYQGHGQGYQQFHKGAAHEVAPQVVQ